MNLMRPMHRAKQVAIFQESEFKRRIPKLLKKQMIHVADKTFDYDGNHVHTQFVLPNFDACSHLAFILNHAITQVAHLHPFYRSVSTTCAPFGVSHTRIDLKVHLQHHKADVLSRLAEFLVVLGWDIVPHILSNHESDRFTTLPHVVQLFDLKTHRSRLSEYACEYACAGSRRIASMLVETSKHHVHVNLVTCVRC
jgi:hypothetical protein